MENFKEYHKEHPECYRLFVQIAKETKYIKKHTRYSARGIIQIMRWHKGGEIKSDGFKINDHVSSYYARMMEKEYPDFEGFFEKRRVKTSTI